MTGGVPRERLSAPVMELIPMNMQVLDAHRDLSGGYKVAPFGKGLAVKSF